MFSQSAVDIGLMKSVDFTRFFVVLGLAAAADCFSSHCKGTGKGANEETKVV
jgi:hypothetical protein